MFDVIIVGQRCRGHDGRALHRSHGPAHPRDREGRTLRRLDRAFRRRHLGAEQRRGAGRGQCRTHPSRRAPIWRTSPVTCPPSCGRRSWTRGPAMLAFVCAHTPLEFRWVRDYADYYPEAPGGQPRGRSVEPVPINAQVLGDELAQLEPPYVADAGGHRDHPVRLPMADARRPTPARLADAPRRSFARRFLPGSRLTMGQALAAGLRAGLRALDVEVRLNTALTDLHFVDRPRRRGSGRREVIEAPNVVLASGGFERNERMRKQHQDVGTEWTVGAKANTGDGIEAGHPGGRVRRR